HELDRCTAQLRARDPARAAGGVGGLAQALRQHPVQAVFVELELAVELDQAPREVEQPPGLLRRPALQRRERELEQRQVMEQVQVGQLGAILLDAGAALRAELPLEQRELSFDVAPAPVQREREYEQRRLRRRVGRLVEQWRER